MGTKSLPGSTYGVVHLFSVLLKIFFFKYYNVCSCVPSMASSSSPPLYFLTDKEEVRDSGIEASGEAEQDSVRELSPSTLGPVSQVNKKAESTEKSESAEKSEEGQSEPLQEKEQVSHHQNGGIAENLDVADAHSDTAIQNGMVEHMDSPEEIMENGEIEVEMEEDDEEDVEEMKRKRWSFPPILDEFDLMATEKDPTELEEIFSDERWVGSDRK